MTDTIVTDFPKTQGDFEQLVDQAYTRGRGAFTFASYLRVNLILDRCKGWLLVVVPMDPKPDYLTWGAEMGAQVVRDLTAACINAAFDRVTGQPLPQAKFSPAPCVFTEAGSTAYCFLPGDPGAQTPTN